MQNSISIRAFIKAVDNEHFDAFLNNGEICMNTLNWFQQYESKNETIGDKYEGAIYAGSKEATLYVAPVGKFDQFKPMANNVADFLLYNSKENGNILSLYSIEVNKDIHVIPEKFVNEFNNHRFCLITVPMSFKQKLFSEILKRGFTPIFGTVSYFAPDNSLQKLNPFLKRDKYKYQRETRIFFHDSEAERQIFKIGSLRDFAFEIFPNEYTSKNYSLKYQDLIITTDNSEKKE